MFEGDGKVLLSRLGDKIHATSAFCTHYGAPLAKGVLTADGRVVWYVLIFVAFLVIYRGAKVPVNCAVRGTEVSEL